MASFPEIIVGLSGGVDSAVSALLLQRAGHTVSGMFMKNWEEDDRFGPCPAADDIEDVHAIGESLGIEVFSRNFSREYWSQVFEQFLAEYQAGRTPNPDVLCNREIKFRIFLDQAQTLGAAHIATGHYVRVDFHEGRYRLLKGIDSLKDQSYFLYTLGQDQLTMSRFPVGGMTKNEVRALARQADLPVHAKKDSTGICFIGERDFKAFLSEYIEPDPGDIRTPDGELVGSHDGLAFYTLGQRGGLGIGGRQGTSGEPWYVVHKDLSTNTLIAAQGHDHPLLFTNHLTAGTLSWVAGDAPRLPWCGSAKVRYRQSDQLCEIVDLDQDGIQVRFDSPQRAVTPGQHVVLYSSQECIGGGTIETAWLSDPASKHACQ